MSSSLNKSGKVHSREHPCAQVTMKYRGTLEDGTEFDAGRIDFTLGAGEVIKGWDKGIEGMRVGRAGTFGPRKPYFAVKTPIDDSRYGPRNQSDDTRE
jgi:hypothetical protein